MATENPEPGPLELRKEQPDPFEAVAPDEAIPIPLTRIRLERGRRFVDVWHWRGRSDVRRGSMTHWHRLLPARSGSGVVGDHGRRAGPGPLVRAVERVAYRE